MDLITRKEAQKLVAGSTERKEELIKRMNHEIKSQAENGLRWAHIPPGVTDFERRWLRDMLAENGFVVHDANPAIEW